jgi:hypothetical protein
MYTGIAVQRPLEPACSRVRNHDGRHAGFRFLRWPIVGEVILDGVDPLRILYSSYTRVKRACRHKGLGFRYFRHIPFHDNSLY